MNFKNMDRRLFTILLIVFVNILGAALILPILPLFAQREFKLSPQVITLLNASFFAAQFVAGPYLGRLSDRYGRVPILIISQVGTAISFVMIAFAHGAPMLFAARILDGITGGNIIVAQAYVTDITPREQRTQSLGYIFAVFGLGFIIGPALGGLLAAAFGARVPYIIAAIVATITVLLTWYTLTESVTPEQRMANRSANRAGLGVSAVMGNAPLLLVLLIAFVGQFAFGLFQSTFALYGANVLFHGYTDKMTSLGVGLLLGAVGVGQLFTQTFLLRPALKRYDEAWLVVAGNLSRAIGMFVYAVIATPWLGPIGALFFAMGMGLSMPPLQALATRSVDDQLRGGILGVFQSVTSLGIILSTGIAGVIFAVSPRLPYWTGTLLSLVAILPAVVLLQRAQAARQAAALAAEKIIVRA
jgi:DHA1 family tetracycline resistance protein-like MFS transporter